MMGNWANSASARRLFHQLDAGDLGQHQVEDDGVRLELAGHLETGFTVERDFDLKTLDSELVPIDVRDDLVVFDD